MVTTGAIERLAGHRGHQLHGFEPGVARGAFAQVEDQAADATAGKIRMRVHRAHAGGVRRDVEQRGIALGGGVIAAIERGAAGPAATARQPALLLDEEIRAVRDQLRVQPHDRFRQLDLRGIEERLEMFSDGKVHQRANGRQVGFGGEAMGEHGRAPPKDFQLHRLTRAAEREAMTKKFRGGS